MTYTDLPLSLAERLAALGKALIDQQAARIIVEPYRNAPGFWFGGGNLVADGDRIWLVGRFRNYGDSRTGLAAGQRGLECAVFASDDDGATFHKVASWSKQDLSKPGCNVLSIEGTALHRRPDGMWEMFISSEKEAAYPDDVRAFQKPGTGVWSIDVMVGPDPSALDPITLQRVLPTDEPDPLYVHIKDPCVFDRDDGTWMIFCSHPFCWSSSNTGLAVRRPQSTRFEVVTYQMVGRGPAWDVAVTRVTDRLAIPADWLPEGAPPTALYFYDGAECVREHEQSEKGVRRPRGYSCEEIGGLMAGLETSFPRIERLSRTLPFFTSPWGTGCSRYVQTLVLDHGILAAWQQSQPDCSQPLAAHFLDEQTVRQILGSD